MFRRVFLFLTVTNTVPTSSSQFQTSFIWTRIRIKSQFAEVMKTTWVTRIFSQCLITTPAIPNLPWIIKIHVRLCVRRHNSFRLRRNRHNKCSRNSDDRIRIRTWLIRCAIFKLKRSEKSKLNKKRVIFASKVPKRLNIHLKFFSKQKQRHIYRWLNSQTTLRDRRKRKLLQERSLPQLFSQQEVVEVTSDPTIDEQNEEIDVCE